MTLKILLIFPPNFSVDQPYISTPMLKAFLKQNGVQVVDQFDANLDAFYYLTKKEFLKKCIKRVRCVASSLKKVSGHLDIDKKEMYQYLCEVMLYYPIVAKNIARSLRYFKHRAETTMSEYNFHKNVIERSFDIISAAYYPSLITPKNFSMRFSNQAFDEIIDATSSPENPYIDYFKDSFIKKNNQNTYDIIGISVTALSQIIPSFTLAKMYKDMMPKVKIVFGGQVFNRLEDNIKQIPQFFHYVDYLILGEGETPFLNLLQHISGTKRITEVPNIMYYDVIEKRVNQTSVMHREHVNQIPPPDYNGLPLAEYLSPTPVLSYQPARGCYWGKCSFCNQFLIAGRGLRSKKSDEIVSDLRYLSQAYVTYDFSIVNESLPPTILKEVASLLINGGDKIRWYAGARFDKRFDNETLQLLKQSGCEKLYFGLESGNQKVLNEMNKGTDIALIRRILQNSKDVGIGIHLFIMIGFPTETMSDLDLSKKFINSILRYVDKDTFSYYISIYQLKPLTPVFYKPDRFNIKNIFKKENYDLEYLYGYERRDSSVSINYEKIKKEIEDMIDGFIGHKKYPENISHFLSFKTAMKENEVRHKQKVYYINPYLSGKSFNNYNSQPRSYLLYDFVYDCLYELPSKETLRFLKDTDKIFTIDELKQYVRDKLNISNKKEADSFTRDLIKNNLFITGGDCNEN
ncbi:MAG: radical SAM protein [Nitrospirae bacterium]|nr:radical SAM protein [Nitrospirota bacterium]